VGLRLIQFDLPPTGNEDVSAFLYKQSRDGQADSAAAASDDSYFSCKLHV
jgi:hypothetical protein